MMQTSQKADTCILTLQNEVKEIFNDASSSDAKYSTQSNLLFGEREARPHVFYNKVKELYFEKIKDLPSRLTLIEEALGAVKEASSTDKQAEGIKKRFEIYLTGELISELAKDSSNKTKIEMFLIGGVGITPFVDYVDSWFATKSKDLVTLNDEQLTILLDVVNSFREEGSTSSF